MTILAFIRKIIVFGIMAVAGIILLIGGIRDKIELSKPMKDISTITPEELYDGQFVEGDIYEMWNEFAYLEESDSKSSSKVKAHYFSFPMASTFDDDTVKFLALRVGNSTDYSTAQKMEKETDDYYAEGIEPTGWTKIHIKGKVTKLKGDLLKFHKEYLETVDGVTASNVNDFLCPYVITSNYGDNTIGLVLGIVFTVLGLGLLAFFIIRKVITGR